MTSLPYYPYKPLSPQCIRVLELHPGASDAPLVCDIVVQHIDGKPYEALSYVWGDPTPAVFVKCIDEANEGALGVGASLAKALNTFRLTGQMRRIWVDAICINQKDVAERQSQVRMMGAVYSKAEHVLCWLGPFNDQEGGESKARLAIGFLRRFNDKPHEHLRAAHQHLHFGDDTEDTDGALLDSWLAIKDLFDVEYFHRAWIIQEVGLARHARLFWGTKDVWVDWTEVATFCSFMDAYGASIINHLQLKSWVANHINLVWATDSSGKPIHSFVEVLHWARVHRSTDPRDYIYALLSHPSATVNGSLLVQPNYTITPAQVYTGLAMNVIERTNNLQILAFVDHHEEPSVLTLPTWVPDWHALNLVAPLRYPTQAAVETDNSISVVESEKGAILKCRGILIDTLRAMSDIIEPSELTVTTLEKEMQKKNPFLIDHIWNKTVVEPGIPLASPGQLFTSLSLVLTGGFLNDSNSTLGEKQEQQQSDCAALILEYERIRLDDHLDGFFASLSPEDKALVQTMATKGSAHQFVQDMTWTSMCRKVFRTAKGYIGLGPRIMKGGDLCVVFLGAAYPMVVRRCDGNFRLVGPALLYGFMNGEAEKLCRNGTLLEQGFEII
ncbi:heterokaryon incompatibility protein [Bisporella sp. PMI_857]|nr:heterokaryon incompatibility protein [Bisporella sp. PMI_857]